jgi:peptidase E
MTNPRPVFLLAGGRGSRNKAVFRAVFKELAKQNPLIAYVGAANDDDQRFFKFMGDEIIKGGTCTLSQALIASPEADLDKAMDVLRRADAVFMSGGDVEAGMKTLISKGMLSIFQDLYEEGKLFFGVSAGSIILCKEWVRWEDPDNDSTAELIPCLGIVPLICDTHAEEDDWEELKAALQLKEDDAGGFGIPSGVCLKVYPDGRTEALGGGVRRYAKRGHKIISLDDLLPG